MKVYKTTSEIFGISLDQYQDCWKLDYDGKPTKNPYTQEPLLDYEKLKARFIAQKYKLDLDIKQGKFISKEVMERYLQVYSVQLQAFMDTIQTKLMSSIQAELEHATGTEMNATDLVQLKSKIKTTHKQIYASLKEEISNLGE